MQIKLLKLKEEIIDSLKFQKPYKIIVFGSYAYGTPNDESDIDLLVVLNQKGMSSSYKMILQNKKKISKNLRGLRKKIPVDLLVYTKDEWKQLKKFESSFIETIEKTGVHLI
ncbi:Nucleotidyltransferase domain-containing protein [Candidatus Magnetomoraceae bacterium gMMP-15]